MALIGILILFSFMVVKIPSNDNPEQKTEQPEKAEKTEFIEGEKQKEEVKPVIGEITHDFTIIRVLLKTTDFKENIHKEVEVSSLQDMHLTYEKDGESIHTTIGANEVLNLEQLYEKEKCTKILIEPSIVAGKIKINSIQRSSGNPQYRGTIEAIKEDNGWVLINEVSMEEYLYSVVPSEMPSTYPMEALKAQAICARTYACSHLQQPGYPEYEAHVDDSVGYQVYCNLEEQEQTNKAVDETAGKIMYFKDQLAQTYYYSTSCGISNDITAFSDIDESLYPYLRAKTITKEQSLQFPLKEGEFELMMEQNSDQYFEKEEPFFRWFYHQNRVDTTELTTRLQNRYVADNELILTQNKAGNFVSEPMSDIGVLLDIKIEKRSSGGCVDEIVLVGENKTIKVLTQYNIRYILKMPTINVTLQDGTKRDTKDLLPSGFFILETAKEEDAVISYTIVGGGYGHGVGMSQNGAKNMAEVGYTSEEILQFFYEGTTVGGTQIQ